MKAMNKTARSSVIDQVTDYQISYVNKMDNINLIVPCKFTKEQNPTKFTETRDGYEYFAVLYSIGLVQYGVYDENGKWWSSNCECINEIFGLDLIEVGINGLVYGIDKRALLEIVKSRGIPVKYNLLELLKSYEEPEEDTDKLAEERLEEDLDDLADKVADRIVKELDEDLDKLSEELSEEFTKELDFILSDGLDD